MKPTLVIIAAILCTITTTVNAQGCLGLAGRKVYLISDNHERLARCHQCAVATKDVYIDVGGVHGKAGDTFAMWTLQEDSTNKCVLKGDNGKYLTRCQDCFPGAAFPQAVVLYPQNRFSLWTMEKHGQFYAFKADNGQYLARCKGCIPGGVINNYAMLYSDSVETIDNALWEISTVV